MKRTIDSIINDLNNFTIKEIQNFSDEQMQELGNCIGFYLTVQDNKPNKTKVKMGFQG